MNTKQLAELKQTLSELSAPEMAEVVRHLADIASEASNYQRNVSGEIEESEQYERAEGHLVQAAFILQKL